MSIYRQNKIPFVCLIGSRFCCGYSRPAIHHTIRGSLMAASGAISTLIHLSAHSFMHAFLLSFLSIPASIYLFWSMHTYIKCFIYFPFIHVFPFIIYPSISIQLSMHTCINPLNEPFLCCPCIYSLIIRPCIHASIYPCTQLVCPSIYLDPCVYLLIHPSMF